MSYTGPSTVRSDDVVLKGTVDPANAHVRVKGQSVKVRKGRWVLPVTLTKHGDNTFRVVATRKGYERSTTTALVSSSQGVPGRCANSRARSIQVRNRSGP